MIAQIINAESIALQNARSDYVLRADVIVLLLKDHTARLIDLNGEFCAITANSASILLNSLQSGSAVAADRIVSEYGIELAQAQNDVGMFLDDLEKRGLIDRSDTFSNLQHTRRKSFEFDPTFLVQRLLKFIDISPISLQAKANIVLGLSYFFIRFLGLPKTIKAWSISPSHYPKIANSLEEIDLAVRESIAHHLLNVQCKERALCCWWLTRSSGIRARLVIGIGLFPLASHCWCEGDMKILADDRDRCEVFTPIFTYE